MSLSEQEFESQRQKEAVEVVVRPLHNGCEEGFRAGRIIDIVGQGDVCVYLTQYGAKVHLTKTCQGLNLTKRRK